MAPLSGLRFSLVGPGRVGRSLAAWARAAGAELVGVAGREGTSAPPLDAPAGAAGPTATMALTPIEELASGGMDLLLLAVPDGTMAEVAARLARRPQARAALHTAGSLDASVLSALRHAGSSVGTFHPLKAFPRALPDPAEARGIFFALDGDPEAVAVGRRLAAAWGAAAAEVPSAARPLYHLAASLAAGGAVTLLALAADLARGLGLPTEVARGYCALSLGAIEAAAAAGDPAAALTGPVARGDLATFTRQVDALAALGSTAGPGSEVAGETSALSPEEPGTADDTAGRVRLVLLLARETLRQAARRAPLGEAQRALLAEVERRLKE